MQKRTALSWHTRERKRGGRGRGVIYAAVIDFRFKGEKCRCGNTGVVEPRKCNKMGALNLVAPCKNSPRQYSIPFQDGFLL